jgi:hypothetical protein
MDARVKQSGTTAGATLIAKGPVQCREGRAYLAGCSTSDRSNEWAVSGEWQGKMPLRRLVQLLAEMTRPVSRRIWMVWDGDFCYRLRVGKLLGATCSGSRAMLCRRDNLVGITRGRVSAMKILVLNRAMNARRWDGSKAGRRWREVLMLFCWGCHGWEPGRQGGRVVGANRSVGRNSRALSQFQQGEMSTARCLW